MGVCEPGARFAFTHPPDFWHCDGYVRKIRMIFQKRTPRMITSGALGMGRFLRTQCWVRYGIAKAYAKRDGINPFDEPFG